MYELKIAWYEITTRYFRIKFVQSIKPSTLVNANFVLTTDEATPQTISDPFETIETGKDYDSISRILTLWWDTSLEVDDYTLTVSNLESYLDESIEAFDIDFALTEAIQAAATPDYDEETRPTRDPLDVEDYSLKHPTWTVDSSTTTTELDYLEIVDVEPDVRNAYDIESNFNEGKIQILFDKPILGNFVSPLYFAVSSKKVGYGLFKWLSVDTSVSVNEDSTIVNIYLPTTDTDGNTIYSYEIDESEVEDYVFFTPETKYRIIVSSDVGS